MSSILVVDDVPIFRALFSTALELDGHDVRCTSTGLDAIGLVMESIPDLLLLDATLPDYSPPEILRVLRQLPTASGMKVVLAVSILDRPVISALSRFGVRDFYLKGNHKPESLRAMVRARLNPGANEEKLHQLLRSVISVSPTIDEVWKRIGFSPEPEPSELDRIAALSAEMGLDDSIDPAHIADLLEALEDQNHESPSLEVRPESAGAGSGGVRR